jgi:hypothetical protein
MNTPPRPVHSGKVPAFSYISQPSFGPDSTVSHKSAPNMIPISIREFDSNRRKQSPPIKMRLVLLGRVEIVPRAVVLEEQLGRLVVSPP